MSDSAPPEDLLRRAFVIGRVGSKGEALTLFDTLLDDVKASAWDEGYAAGMTDDRYFPETINPYWKTDSE